MNRTERRATASTMRRQASAWPRELTEIPESEWPYREPGKRPRAVWRSREFLVQAYDERRFAGIEVRRLSVDRVEVDVGGHWAAEIGWDELQRVKRESGHGDWYALEVYPRDRDIVNVANMRHLWLLAEPLSIGWVVP